MKILSIDGKTYLPHIIKEEVESFLSEGLSDILYHGTYISNAENILKTNTFYLTNAIGTPADLNKNRGNEYFLSTQRANGLTGYISKQGLTVIFVLDGRKLAQNYRGFPTDYWNWSMNRDDYDNESGYRQALQSKELEDRIISKNPTIPDANKYIKEIHVLYDRPHERVRFFRFINNAKELGIPTFIYQDKNAFKSLNKNAAEKNLKSLETRDDEEKLEERPFEQELRSLKVDILGLLTFNPHNEGYEDYHQMDKLKEIYPYEFIEEHWESIEYKLAEKRKQLLYQKQYLDSLISELRVVIHNNKSTPNKYLRQIMHLLVQDMRTMGVNDISSYIKKKLNIR